MLRQTSVPRMRSSRSHDYSDEREVDWFLESVRPFRRCALFARLYRSLWKFELDEIISWHDARDGRRARRKHRFCFFGEAEIWTLRFADTGRRSDYFLASKCGAIRIAQADTL